MNIKKMTTDDLKKLSQQVQAELSFRKRISGRGKDAIRGPVRATLSQRSWLIELGVSRDKSSGWTKAKAAKEISKRGRAKWAAKSIDKKLDKEMDERLKNER